MDHAWVFECGGRIAVRENRSGWAIRFRDRGSYLETCARERVGGAWDCEEPPPSVVEAEEIAVAKAEAATLNPAWKPAPVTTVHVTRILSNNYEAHRIPLTALIRIHWKVDFRNSHNSICTIEFEMLDETESPISRDTVDVRMPRNKNGYAVARSEFVMEYHNYRRVATTMAHSACYGEHK